MLYFGDVILFFAANKYSFLLNQDKNVIQATLKYPPKYLYLIRTLLYLAKFFKQIPVPRTTARNGSSAI